MDRTFLDDIIMLDFRVTIVSTFYVLASESFIYLNDSFTTLA